jgi:hypothetical protein
MVVDLQGVNYILTDPQIHTYNPATSTAPVNQFGEGNLGLPGMISFFATHSCNHICKKLGLVCFEDAPSKPFVSEVKPVTESAKTPADEDEEEIVNDLLAEQFHSKLDVSGLEEEDSGKAEASEEGAEVKDKLLEKMEVSCDLCANLMMVKHKTVIKLYQRKQSITCADCFQQLANKVTVSCKGCTTSTFQYSPYFYRTVGMVPPRFCHSCKVIKNKGYSKKPTK